MRLQVEIDSIQELLDEQPDSKCELQHHSRRIVLTCDQGAWSHWCTISSSCFESIHLA